MRRLLMTAMVLGLMATAQAEAAIILSTSGTNVGGYAIGSLGTSGYSQVVAFSWTQTQAYSNVSIAVPLLASGAADTVNAYLVRGVVPQPISNQVAATTFLAAGSLNTYSIFSGLNLAAGSYSLVLSSITSSNYSLGWQYSETPTTTVVAAPGVSYPSPAYTSVDTSRPVYDPNDPNFKATNQGLTLNISITGNLASVPEPTSALMVGLGGVVTGMVGLRRSRRRPAA